MKFTARLLLWIVVFICTLPPILARAQSAQPSSEVDAIRKEMEQLRRDYEERIKKLEAVETARPAPAVPPPTAPIVAATPGTAAAGAVGSSTNAAKKLSPEAAEAAAKGREFAREQYTRNTETREIAINARLFPRGLRPGQPRRAAGGVSGAGRAGEIPARQRSRKLWRTHRRQGLVSARHVLARSEAAARRHAGRPHRARR
jgi:hypothetical protein